MAILVSAPCVVFEDEHLLVVNKPAGMNTHSPSPYAGEGIYEWLRHREPRWSSLAIVHRLDKETSGLMLFTKTPLANRSVTAQFTAREIQKSYRLVTDREVPFEETTVRSCLIRSGEKYLSRPVHVGGGMAETRFRVINRTDGRTGLMAEPVTGRTHQIRVHAASLGLPILGDSLYDGTTHSRLCLHSASLRVRHPATGESRLFTVEPDFEADSRQVLRAAFVDPVSTTAFRLLHGAADGWPGWYVERLGEFILSQAGFALSPDHLARLEQFKSGCGARGVYHKLLNRQARHASTGQASPQLVLGEAAPDRFAILENGLRFETSFGEGYSYGLFLDQRDNRRRLLTGGVAAGFSSLLSSKSEVLNTFAYTCGFSVCAARTGARVTSLDLSRKYLDWGRCNFALNAIDSEGHEFIHGDAFDWLRRFARKGRRFDVVILDPPTFSQSKASGVFRAQKDYEALVSTALPVLKSGGVLLASTNAATLEPEDFLSQIRQAVTRSGRAVLAQHFVPQPPDFPSGKLEPAYLKTVWMRIG